MSADAAKPQSDDAASTGFFPTTDNPAQRLLDVFTLAATKPDGTPFSKVIAETFGFRQENKVMVYRTIGYIHDLIDQVEVRMNQISSIDHKLYLADLPTLRAVVSPRDIEAQWNTLARPLQHGALTSIRFCASELKKTHDEIPLSEDQLGSLRAQLDELFKSVLESDLDADLKAVIYDLLTSVRISLDNYLISGLDGVKRSLTYSIGLLDVHKERFKGKQNKLTIKLLGKFVSDLATIVSSAAKMKKIGLTIVAFLGLTSGS